jgi:sucrose 6(F)-phosphate phosphorylase
MPIKNQVQLITYPDSLGGDLRMLGHLLNGPFHGLFAGGVHILPPFPSSGDRGFAPLTYLEIEPRFGTWEDIRSIAETHDVMIDVMVNHISRKSVYFQDFLEKGRESEYADMFITLEKMWRGGEPMKEDVDKIFLRRPKPYSEYRIKKTGEPIKVWTTFGKEDPSEQIDLDVHSEKTKQLLLDILDTFGRNGVKIVRLDAVGYVIKKLGTSCFFVEPEIYGFLDWITELARSRGIEIIPEVHSDYSIQFKLAEKGYWIYDFILPYTILSALIRRNGARLKWYLKNRPANQITMLDCHDGIPVLPDMEGLVDLEEARRVVDVCVERGARLSLILSEEHKALDGFDVHQICGTYYSLLDENDDAYLAARAIQLFAPGVPQVYYVGLLAGKNDDGAIEQTGDIREINRHNYSLKEVEEALERDVVRRQLELIRFRNTYPAFQGDFSLEDSADDCVSLLWQKGDKYCCLTVDLQTYRSEIEYIGDDGRKSVYAV